MIDKNDEEKARSNASKIEQEIEKLRYNHLDPNAPTAGYLVPSASYLYHDFWTHAKEIVEMFKTLKPLLKEDREQLWQRYQSICEDVKRRQNEEFEESRKSREIIGSLINDAYHQAGGASNREELDKAKSMQTENLRMMKEKRLFKEDRETLWKLWIETNERISWKRHELQESNFLQAKGEASRVINTAYYGDPYKALEDIKEVQRSLYGTYMDKERWQELRETLNDAWNHAISRIGEVKEEKKRKHEEWRKRMEGNIERWETDIKKAKDYVSSLEEQIDRLEEEEAEARSAEYAERARGWIEEKEEKISEVREQMAEWEEKIRSVKDKLE